MASSIVVKGIQVSARCGVTETERHYPQPLLVDLIFQCPNQQAFQSDRLSDTVDYGSITRRIRDIGEGQAFSLIETLTEKICQTLFHEFPITHLKIWVRKIHPPLDNIKGSVTGIVPDRPGTGTYEVFPDCSGVTEFQPDPNNPNLVIRERFVILDNGNEIWSMAETPAPLMVTTVGKRVRKR